MHHVVLSTERGVDVRHARSDLAGRHSSFGLDSFKLSIVSSHALLIAAAIFRTDAFGISRCFPERPASICCSQWSSCSVLSSVHDACAAPRPSPPRSAPMPKPPKRHRKVKTRTPHPTIRFSPSPQPPRPSSPLPRPNTTARTATSPSANTSP